MISPMPSAVRSCLSSLPLALLVALAAPDAAPAQSCASDCDGSGDVTVAELVKAVNIALGSASINACAAADRNGDGSVSVNELIGAVNAALGGCTAVSPAPTRTPTATVPLATTPTFTPTPGGTPGAAPNQLDASFGDGGLAAPRVGLGRTYIAGLAAAPGGAVAFTGDLTAGTQFNGYAARLTGAGALDLTFNGMGVRPVDVWTCTGGGISNLNESMYDIAVDGSGRVLIAGYTIVDGATRRFSLARFTSSGALDTTFGTNGCLTVDANPDFPEEYVSSMTLQPDGRILLAGWTASKDGDASTAALVRLTADGVLDTGFADGGRFLIDGYPGNKSLGVQVERVAVDLQSDGRIIFMHTVLVPGPSVAFGLTRLTAGGQLDPSFGDGGTFVHQAVPGRFNFAVDLAVVAGDRIVVGGSARNADNKYDFALLRTTADGALDASFGSDGVALVSLGAVDGNDYLGDLVVDSAGRIVAAGVRYAINEMPNTRVALARFDADGQLDAAGFCASGTLGPVAISNVRALVDAQDRLLVSYVAVELGNPTPDLAGIGILRFNGGAGAGVCSNS